MQADFVDQAAADSVAASVVDIATTNWNAATNLGATMDDLATFTANQRMLFEADTDFTATPLHEHVAEVAAADHCADLSQAIAEQNTLRDEINAAAGFGQWLQAQLGAMCEHAGTEYMNTIEDILEITE
jgi:hypothetical protein